MAGYIFKIMLEHTHPPVWRRVLVPEKITFYELHKVIQTVFGWEDDHLHSFSIPSQHIQIGGCDDAWSWSDYDEERTLLEQFIFGQKSIRYTYDFGDNWIHKIVFEKEDETYKARVPALLKAKGENFLEDTGGVWGADDPENRCPFEEEKVKAKLEEMCFSEHEDLQADLEKMDALRDEIEKAFREVAGRLEKEIDVWREERQEKREPSAVAKEIDAWKRFMAAGGKRIELKRGNRTNEQLLNGLDMQELKDYCKYLQIPTVKSWGREKLAGMFREHPEYLMYVFFENEWKELNRVRKLAETKFLPGRKYLNMYIKAMALGLMRA